jgi:hypothetical protein
MEPTPDAVLNFVRPDFPGRWVAYLVSFQFNVAALVLFGPGNFIYIGASDPS